MAVYYVPWIHFWLSYIMLRDIASCSMLALFMSKINNSVHDDHELYRSESTMTLTERICHKIW